MHKPAMLPAVATILLAMACAACAKTERPRLTLPPVSLTTCADEPQAPDLPAPAPDGSTQPLRDALVFDYILGLRAAWGDCHAKVEGVKAWRGVAGG